MLTKIILVINSMKNYFIAGCLIVAGLIASVFIGRVKQKKIDKAEVDNTVSKTLEKIRTESNDVQAKSNALPDHGPSSIDSELRDNFTAPD